ncbi:RNA-binding protein 4 isoform X2 [Neomonachus schauinslandi]|uniref:RNA-binding protein 4 isoform X2 n=1 Tax=Neomonachus schauinslandi TaxID=29088 RepID=A0A2Y9GTQ1_NEOSC|nr:RNA-binding protein 4 isoform X2 [Neomonachus schauinslandi]
MVKLFIGNLPREATEQEIRSLFEQYGKVLECDIIKNYGFVHIEDKTAAEDAIRNLHHYKLHGVNINVEASKNKSKTSTKLHVGNISPTCTNKELRAKFEEYGPVIECDIVKDYAFVHMERAEDAVEAIRGLDNTEFQGKRMHVQLSTSRLRTAPGMGDQSGCYRWDVCGLKFRAAVVHENTPFVVPHLRDVLGSVRSVPQEPWTLIYLAKFRPPLPFLLPAHFPVLPVLQYFCSFPFMFCSPSRPHCVQKLWWGLCCLPASCFQWVLDLGMTLMRVSLFLSLFGPKACGG